MIKLFGQNGDNNSMMIASPHAAAAHEIQDP
jgi:hypothetical protein